MGSPGYQTLLLAELEKRRQRNQRYSLRAFARAIGVSPSFLSQVMGKKKGLSMTTATEIVQKLEWTGSQREIFLAFVSLSAIENQALYTHLAQAVAKFYGGTVNATDPELSGSWPTAT